MLAAAFYIRLFTGAAMLAGVHGGSIIDVVIPLVPEGPSGTPEMVQNATTPKAIEEFRVYDDEVSPRVREHYRMMRLHHTAEFYDRMAAKYDFSNGTHRRLMTIEQAFDELEHYVDASDPDLDLPNLIHLLQTAEGIRNDGHEDWFQLVGLLHDIGKIMFLWGAAEDGQESGADGQQWALGGDTFVVGCKIPDEAVVFPEYNNLNIDSTSRYKNKNGIYEPGCGLDKLKFAWGHDEYGYRMVEANGGTIPQAGMDMIRYHSAYPLHDKGAYKHLLAEGDEERLQWISLFNKYDLYTKDQQNPLDPKALLPYYLGIAEKYGLGGVLRW